MCDGLLLQRSARELEAAKLTLAVALQADELNQQCLVGDVGSPLGSVDHESALFLSFSIT